MIKSQIRRGRPGRRVTPETVLELIAMVVFIYVGMFSLAVGIHDFEYTAEDSKVVWICSYHGNKMCGPNEPAIQIRPHRLLFG